MFINNVNQNPAQKKTIYYLWPGVDFQNNPRKKDSSIKQWFHSLVTLISMVCTQASCVPNGNHGLYHRFGIEVQYTIFFYKSVF